MTDQITPLSHTPVHVSGHYRDLQSNREQSLAAGEAFPLGLAEDNMTLRPTTWLLILPVQPPPTLTAPQPPPPAPKNNLKATLILALISTPLILAAAYAFFLLTTR